MKDMKQFFTLIAILIIIIGGLFIGVSLLPWKQWQESFREQNAEKEAKIRKSRNELPIELIVKNAGLPEDLRDDADLLGYPQSERKISVGETILYHPVLSPAEDGYAERLKTKFGEPYGKIRIFDKVTGTFQYKWWSFRIIDKNLKAQEEERGVKSGDKVAVAQPPILVSHTPPRDPWITLPDGTLTVNLLPGEWASKTFTLMPGEQTPKILVPENYYTFHFQGNKIAFFFERNGIKSYIKPNENTTFQDMVGDQYCRIIADKEQCKVDFQIARLNRQK